MSALEPMTYEECVFALDSVAVGRVSVTTSEGPYTVPVNFAVLNERIYFRADPGGTLGTHVVARRVAFEVDSYTRADQSGWSVLARGRGHVISEQLENTWMTVLDRPRPWAPRPGLRLFAISWEHLTGRRLRPADGTDGQTDVMHPHHRAHES